MKLILYTDGAARGNPGPAAIGIVLADMHGTVVDERGETLGNKTNNEAEYQALLRGLGLAKKHHADEIEIRADSELLVMQLKGNYRVKAANLKPLYAQAQRALKEFAQVEIRHIPRELNRRADSLANQALDQAREL